ncbi:MAG: VOC family protein [Thermoleophilia bacterium]
MGAISGIDTVFYQVCNMERAVEFYRDALGLELQRREGNDWAEFAAGPLTLSLSGELAVAPQRGAPPWCSVPKDWTSWRRASARWDGRGSIDDLGGARMVDIYDPDGNQIVLMEPV